MSDEAPINRAQLELLHLQVLGMQAQLAAIERGLALALGVPGSERARSALPDATESARSTPPRVVSDAARRLLDQTRTPEEQRAATFMHGKNRDRIEVDERPIAPDAHAAPPSGHGEHQPAGD